MRRTAIIGVALAALVTGCDAMPGTVQGAAKSHVGEHLVDRYSARYRFIATTKVAVCGSVNAKNRMGAYSGDSLFIFDRGSTDVTIFAGPASVSDLRRLRYADGDREAAEIWQEIETACTFPKRWLEGCGSAAAIPYDEQVCTPWLKRDNAAIFDLAERY